MHKLKLMVAALLLVMSTSILSPVPAQAVSLDSPTVETGGILGVLLSLLNSNVFSKLNLSDTKQVNTLPPVIPTTPILPVTPSVKTSSKKEVVGFYAEWHSDDQSSYNDLVKHHDAINTIAPLWAGLKKDGTVIDRGGANHASVVKYANANNIDTLLLVNTADGDIHAVLADAKLRTKAIDNLEAYIKKYGLTGINIDFEGVQPWDKDNLTQFMKELSGRLKPAGYLVTIDVFPKHNETTDIAIAYDYAALAKYADKIFVMTYDYHGGWGSPGAVADLPLVEQDIKYALTLIPSNKLYLGVAGYGYDWSSKGNQSLEYGAIANLINKFGATVEWDDTAKSPHFTYTGNDKVKHQVWYENHQSLQYKLNLVNKYDLAGIALWKLGQEDPADWDVIKSAFK